MSTADPLESLLLQLQAFGRPRLSLLSGGWLCRVEMNVTAVGASFEIASDFYHATPTAAAHECAERVRTTLGGLNVTMASLPALPHG